MTATWVTRLAFGTASCVGLGRGACRAFTDLAPCAALFGLQSLTDADRSRIEKRMEAATKENQRFERVEVLRDEALSMFQENKFKVWQSLCQACLSFETCCISRHIIMLLHKDAALLGILVAGGDHLIPATGCNHQRVPCWAHGGPVYWPSLAQHWVPEGMCVLLDWFLDSTPVGNPAWHRDMQSTCYDQDCSRASLHPRSSLTLQALAVTNQSRAFWRGDVKREPLQRIYAITFPDPKQLKEYQFRMEEVGVDY